MNNKTVSKDGKLPLVKEIKKSFMEDMTFENCFLKVM